MANFITRPFLCSCHDKHERATHYIAFGGGRKTLIYYEIEEPIINDITPHIVSYAGSGNGIVPIAVTCGIIGCGVELKNPTKVDLGIIMLNILTYTLPLKEWNALELFKDTGFELKTSKRWKQER